MAGNISKHLQWLFPNGIGMKGIIACIVIGIGLPMLEAAAIKEIALIVVTFYFSYKLSNGNKPAT